MSRGASDGAGTGSDKVASERIIWDGDLPGLELRMRPGGFRNWVYQYKIGARHRRMLPVLLAALMCGVTHIRDDSGSD